MDISKNILLLLVFLITCEHLVSGTECDQLIELTASVNLQYFTSPGYPIKYPPNLECNYTIRTQRSTDRVEIKVWDTDIENTAHCQNDWVTFININNGTEQILGTICGSETARYQSSGNSLQIKFVSNSHKVNKGFKISYKAIDRKDGTMFALTATKMTSFLVSPGYPFHYYSDLGCHWLILSLARPIDVSVIRSSIAGNGPNCTGDRLEVANTDIGDKAFCGNATPSFELQKFLFVSLYTDGNTEAQGFLIKYRLKGENTTIPTCGGSLEAKTGGTILQSPLYPITLLMNQTCKWNITAADPNEVIMITLIDLDLEMSTDCVYDSLSIYNVSSMVHGKTLETWCGKRGGDVMYSTGPDLTIVYTVDDSNNWRGFSLIYSAVTEINATQESTQINVKDTINYLTVGFSDYFTRDRVYSFVFSTTVGQLIKLEAKLSSLPGVIGSCTEGTKVIVYDGPTNAAPILASVLRNFTWCGKTSPKYTSTNNSLLLEYHTGNLANKDFGFELSYMQGIFPTPDSVCGETSLTADLTDSILTSPYYPNPYPNNLNCSWNIDSDDYSYVVMVEVLRIDLEYSEGCRKDYLMIDDFGSSSSGGRWCGNRTQKYQSIGRYLTIDFHTDWSVTKSGFRLKYWRKHQTHKYDIGYEGVNIAAVVGGTVGGLCLLVMMYYGYRYRHKCTEKRPTLVTTGSSYIQTEHKTDSMANESTISNTGDYKKTFSS